MCRSAVTPLGCSAEVSPVLRPPARPGGARCESGKRCDLSGTGPTLWVTSVAVWLVNVGLYCPDLKRVWEHRLDYCRVSFKERRGVEPGCGGFTWLQRGRGGGCLRDLGQLWHTAAGTRGWHSALAPARLGDGDELGQGSEAAAPAGAAGRGWFCGP